MSDEVSSVEIVNEKNILVEFDGLRVRA